MANDYFSFKQFTINQDHCAFKVGTDGVILGAAADLDHARTVLDIGTGTGLIAIMCAQRSLASVTAIEPDPDSFRQACENTEQSPWKERIKVYNSDLQSYIPKSGDKYDLIISNPPYFRHSLLNPDAKKASSRHTFSLSSEDLILHSERLLCEKGSLQLILPYEEGTVFMAEAAGSGFYCNSIIKVRPVPEGKVIRLVMKLERERKPLHERFLTIETGTRHYYTDEYKALTRDFYLKF